MIRDYTGAMTQYDYTIRPLVAADFYDYCNLMSALVTDQPVPRDTRGEDLFDALINAKGVTVFGADLEGHIVSTATLFVMTNLTYDGRPCAFVENVVTLSEFRGHGIGRAVMQHLLDETTAQNVYKVQLLTGQDYGARGFYETLGFNASEKYGMSLRQVPTRRPAA